ncbi:hypothetical protein [Paenarthrobacter sp. NPDC058040]|uniref:hypothetical protein n=1 Tax=unclassified Paenarthrobacter TaxID=2634190 RepID=UPI0036D8092E
MRLRSWGTAVAVLVLSGTLGGVSASPGAAYALPGAAQPTPGSSRDGQPSGWLELDAGPAAQAHQLTPGGTARWAVDVKVRGEPASALEVWLEPGAVENGEQLLREHLSIELQACAQPWTDGTCAGGLQELLDPTPLADAEGARVQLEDPGPGGSTGTYVLLTAALADDAPREVQGTRTRIILGVHGAGDDPGSSSSPPNQTGPGHAGEAPPSGFLANTGAQLGGFALLGVLAVGAGFGLARMRGAKA